MKLLSGSEIAGYVKQRQTKQVRSLRQAQGIEPKLAIIKTTDDPVIATYVALKKRYGADIGVEVEEHSIDQAQILDVIKSLNNDTSVSGIIVQLPITDPSQLDEVLSAVDPAKDVDGLGDQATHTPATAMAISWLLDGFNVNLAGKQIAIVGQGRLVGGPLTKLLRQQGYEPYTYDQSTTDLTPELRDADVVVSATGQGGLITTEMIKHGAVAVDAGVAEQDGQKVGDFSEELYNRDDLTITPKKGGVGPLTVCALFENVIRSASS